MSAQAPLDRLDARDLFQQLDWMRDEWATTDEYGMVQKMLRLRRHFEHLPTRYWDDAQPLLHELAHARVVNGRPWHATIRALAEIVSAWDRSRPPLLTCPDCDLQVRGHRQLETHRYVVHDVQEAA